MNQPFLILGGGYVGQRLTQRLSLGNLPCVTTHRNQDMVFDLEDENTWSNLPEAQATVWTFPAKPIALVEKFLDAQKDRLGKLVVLGSTGSFRTAKVHEKVNEMSDLDDTIERVQGEKYILSQGGILLCAAGIYGPGRNPKAWLSSSRSKHPEKLVNVIHVEDLLACIFACLDVGKPGQVYIASDGKPKSWNELAHAWQSEMEDAKVLLDESTLLQSKSIDPSHTLSSLEIELLYPDVLDGAGHLIDFTLTKGNYIELQSLLKATNLCQGGAEAKSCITGGEVLVDGAVETRRGKKIYPGQEVGFNHFWISVDS